MRTITCDRCGSSQQIDKPKAGDDIASFALTRGSGPAATFSVGSMILEPSTTVANVDLCATCRTWLVDEMNGKHRVTPV
jgi:hypothetical protein